jgi:hypothetical protein
MFETLVVSFAVDALCEERHEARAVVAITSKSQPFDTGYR